MSAAGANPVLLLVTRALRDLELRLEQAERGRCSYDDVLRALWIVDDRIDALISALTPERITDVRFEMAMKALDDVESVLGEIREAVRARRFHQARTKIARLEAAVRKLNRVMTLIHAGAPLSVILVSAPDYARAVPVSPPEELAVESPIAQQIYAIVTRAGSKGKAVDEIMRELRISEEQRGEFNRAVALLIARGYVHPEVGPDNRLILKPTGGA